MLNLLSAELSRNPRDIVQASQEQAREPQKRNVAALKAKGRSRALDISDWSEEPLESGQTHMPPWRPSKECRQGASIYLGSTRSSKLTLKSRKTKPDIRRLSAPGS
jgi:hypothetical protein